jgi:hypothetical protein
VPLAGSGHLVAAAQTVLDNGIVLGNPWPPAWSDPQEHPHRPPYLMRPPAVIPIDVGRQLFVDDFLIEQTTLVQATHQATYFGANPVLRPDQPWEQRDEASDRTNMPRNPAAMVFSDGVFFDPHDRLFKMWYMGGYGMSTCLATSEDGRRWHKPQLDVVAGTNIVDTRSRDSSTVWLDGFAARPDERYKMTVWKDGTLTLLLSRDGVRWRELGRTREVGDRSTFFYNPFRRVWVFSLRAEQFPASSSGRFRRYWETPEFRNAVGLDQSRSVAWVKADSRDHARPELARAPELYNLDCVAYESVLLGLFSVWRGESSVREKVNEVLVGFSRDGFHWHRPDRRAFLPVSDQPGTWNFTNVQSAGGCCLIVGDELHFYVSGRSGRPGTAAPGVCSTGLATLRRDGFASMDWLPGEMPAARLTTSREGMLITRPVRFSGSYLFVNADLTDGEMRIEIVDERGLAIAPFTREACEPLRGNHTGHRVRWTTDSIAAVAGRTVRFRFWTTRGRLYSFWVSPSRSGESRGYSGAGGPGFRGPQDVPAA